MLKDLPENKNCNCCCVCSMNCPKNQKPLQKKEESGWLWAVLIGGGLAIAMSGCVPEANTSNLEPFNSSPAQMWVN